MRELPVKAARTRLFLTRYGAIKNLDVYPIIELRDNVSVKEIFCYAPGQEEMQETSIKAIA